jgi:threonine dehydrogenase-like Zn-dependent dehydrogenase
MALQQRGVETINFDQEDVFERVKSMTGGRGPDACIDAVGLEAHGHTLDSYVDKAKAAAFLATDRPNALRQAIHCCRKGGIVSIPGVYGGFLDKIPFGAAFQKGLTFRMGQTHMMRYMKPLLDRIERGDIDPSFVITHRLALDDAPRGYKMFRDKQDRCIKIVLKPNGETVH